MKFAALWLIALTVPTSAVTLIELKSQFQSGLSSQCFQKQRAAAENSKLPDQVLTQYCACVARHAEDTVHVEDMLASVSGPMPRRMQNELTALGAACADVVSGKIKDGPSFEKR
jgi:hypothetical protein